MISRLARRSAPSDRREPPVAEVARAPFARSIGPRPDDARSAVTDILHGRLTDGDLAEVEERIEPGYQTMWDAATPVERRRVSLSFGLLYGVPGVIEHTGLSPATPPREVHSMVHGWVTEIGGSYYLADMVYEAVASTGAIPTAGDQVLDFSCSSGRVVRPLAAALPEAAWHGCDPNRPAIEWMAEHVPEVEVLTSPTAPPLPYEAASFELVFAMSVWSHYSAAGALRWLEELARVVRPGGRAVITAHGLQACVWFTINRDPAIGAKLGDGWIDETRGALERDGHCFWDVFGDAGDWGVVDPEWGLAFFTPEWLLERITPAWSLLSYRIGGAHGNQDVYVLRRQ